MKSKKPPADRHASGFLVRLPELMREPLEKLRTKHRRPITTEVQIALEKHFTSEGVRVQNVGTL